jgi:uncharacterized protein
MTRHKTPPASDETVLQRTQQWFERAVIGLNLCPFAKAAQQRGQIRWVLCPARTRVSLAEALAEQALQLSRADPQQHDTTVIIHPHVLKPFTAYLDFLPLADEVLKSLRLHRVLQIASFHPQFRFAERPMGDISHASNQSPYPLLHLLREDSVARAVAAFPDAAAIYQRNIQTLQGLGHEGWQELLNAPEQAAP